MKKTIILLITVSMLLMCMTACSGLLYPELTPGGDTPPTVETETIYEKLDKLSDMNYQVVRLDIVTTMGDIQLSSYYILTKSNVRYSVERLNMLPLDGDVTEASAEYKTTHLGSAKIVNGIITEFDSAGVTLPSYNELKGKFSFNESNFKNAVVGINTFEADVVSSSQFYGADVNVRNLKVKVEYTDASLIRITVTYNTTNATVQNVYTFGN